MEFECEDGPCALVDAGSDGQRLQSFVARAFREQLGRCEGHLHVSCRGAAKSVLDAGGVRVNGAPAPGRHVLRTGDLVALCAAGGTAASASAQHGRARMSLSLDDEAEEAEATPPAAAAGAREAFRRYYEAQRLWPAAEWAAVEAAFVRPLALCVRAVSSAPSHERAVRELCALFGAQLAELPWACGAYSLRLAAEGDAPGRGGGTAKSQEAEEAAAALLQAAMGNGELVLQEAAAMLPALALMPRYDHYVLDLCAAPGGKTLQLLDLMALNKPPAAGRSHAAGCLVSNDLNLQRQERTLRRARCGWCLPLVVTCCDARSFGLSTGCGDGARPLEVRYDRVLCDVPCGGDGTLRKSPSKWQRWSVRTGLRIHATQLQILRKGISLLRPGGILVYSTCALDPLQNEAVVHAALLEYGDELELLCPSDVLPQATSHFLKRADGLTHWRVPHPDYPAVDEMYEAWADVPLELREAKPGHGTLGPSPSDAQRIGHKRTPPAPTLLAPSMFTTSAGEGGSAREALTRCIRLLPTHGEEFGGFFLCAIRKSAHIGLATPLASGDASLLFSDGDAALDRSRLRAPVVPSLLEHISSFFGIPSLSECADSARTSADRDGALNLNDLAVTAEDSAAGLLVLSLTSPLARMLGPASCPETHGQVVSHAGMPQLSIVGAGTPVFCAMPPHCEWWPREARWRVCQESANLVGMSASRRILLALPAAAKLILSKRRTTVIALQQLHGRGELRGLESCGIRPVGEQNLSVTAESENGGLDVGQLIPGAVVLMVGAKHPQSHALSCLLDSSGLLVLTQSDVVQRAVDYLQNEAIVI
ncbi:hypothetical protein AB1Y20_007443 [Prymnesium parvum]|uniref:SAM-dependent MTase RsmB/NOP-type domain-containing protein n=1 Tax=Prymnesium parvum TaxID=97485 RepID=A0AB34IV83_PRYPA